MRDAETGLLEKDFSNCFLLREWTLKEEISESKNSFKIYQN